LNTLVCPLCETHTKQRPHQLIRDNGIPPKLNKMDKLSWTPISLVSEFLGEKGTIGYKVGNVLRENKQIQLHLVSNDGKTAIKPCLSDELSVMLRNRKMTMGDVEDYLLSVSNIGTYSIHRPEEAVVNVDRKKMTKSAPVKLVAVTHQDLIAL